ncbi:MAG: hypothetical protein RMJ07_03420 [Nitrososphaerota archaeon]|nr:hypothetical protein [Candidatus Bathyarchaeota archaeon]MDW8048712.1 hypothetical protein [Nitrososphaerota archaeon]
MADWRAVYENWDLIPEEDRKLIEKLMREKPKEKLAELFRREPYAKMVYEKVVGVWGPPAASFLRGDAGTSSFKAQGKAVGKDGDLKMTATEGKTDAHIGISLIDLLPILSLSVLLISEIAYYNPAFTAFLDALLPFNLKAWLFLLALALALGFVSIAYLIKVLGKAKIHGGST